MLPGQTVTALKAKGRISLFCPLLPPCLHRRQGWKAVREAGWLLAVSDGAAGDLSRDYVEGLVRGLRAATGGVVHRESLALALPGGPWTASRLEVSDAREAGPSMALIAFADRREGRRFLSCIGFPDAEASCKRAMETVAAAAWRSGPPASLPRDIAPRGLLDASTLHPTTVRSPRNRTRPTWRAEVIRSFSGHSRRIISSSSPAWSTAGCARAGWRRRSRSPARWRALPRGAACSRRLAADRTAPGSSARTCGDNLWRSCA